MKESQRAHDYIRNKILIGALPAGARVSDVTMAVEIGVSRTPVREAINQLYCEGLLNQIPHVGAFVRELSRRELEDLYDLRALLEGYAAEQAATRITEADLAELNVLCDDLRRFVRKFRDSGATTMDAETAEQSVVGDIKFHMIILRACGNQQVAKIVSDFRIMTSLCGTKRPDPRKTVLHLQATTWMMHSRILRGLRTRSPDTARRWMSTHLQKAKDLALAHFDQHQASGTAKDDLLPASVQNLLSQMEHYQPVGQNR